MRLATLTGALALLLSATTVQAQEKVLPLRVTGAKTGEKNVPVAVPLSLPPEWVGAVASVAVELPGGQAIPGQLTSPGLSTDEIAPSVPKLERRNLHFILPKIDAEQVLEVKARLSENPAKKVFAWKVEKGEYAELDEEGRPVLRFIRKPYDDSTAAKRDASYKVFHHLFDPAGKQLVTAGGYADSDSAGKKLLYPHHRGLMYGFNKITYGDGKKADTWHCTNGVHIAYVKDLATEAGPVLGRQRVLLDWVGGQNDVFAKEEREVTVYDVPGGTLVRFVSHLQSTSGKVKLDGDPQHAGFQFRASQDVADHGTKETYFLTPGGKGEKGKESNWPQDQSLVDLPWYAMSFVVNGKRYTALYLNSPLNPRPTRFSERTYGRFGGYFVYELTADRSLTVNYAIWLQDGEITGQRAQELYQAFAQPPLAKVVTK